jgi:hypothetical protein
VLNKIVMLILKRSVAYVLDICLLFAILAPAALLIEQLLGIFPRTPSQVWLAAVVSFSMIIFILRNRLKLI